MRRLMQWVATVFAAVALSTVIVVTLLSVQATKEHRRNDHVVCVAVNRIADGAVAFVNDLLADPRIPQATKDKVVADAKTHFPDLDCSSSNISFK